MALWTELMEPSELTAFARRAQGEVEAAKGSLGAFFPSQTIDTDVARYTVTDRGLVSTAEFRSWDAEAAIGGSTQGKRVTVELPPISQKTRIGELDQLRVRAGSTQVDQAQLDIIGRAVADNVTAITERLEVLRGTVLDTGRITIAENGFHVDEDLGRKTEMTATAGTKWDQTDSDPLQDLLAWAELYSDENGAFPAEIVASRKVFNVLMRNASVRSAIAGNAARSVASVDELNALLASYGLPVVRVYDRRANVGGKVQRILPEEKIYLLPAAGSNELGSTVFGRTVEADDPEYSLVGADAPGLVASMHKQYDPHGYWARVTGVALPVMTNPNASMVATVLTAA